MTSSPALPLILIVDDSPSIRESLTVAFDARGLRCATAADGESAIALARDGDSLAVAIVAYHLPQASGAETARILKHLCPDVFLIGTSTQHERRDDMLAAGASLFLEKPFDIAMLMSVIIEKLTAKPNALDQVN